MDCIDKSVKIDAILKQKIRYIDWFRFLSISNGRLFFFTLSSINEKHFIQEIATDAECYLVVKYITRITSFRFCVAARFVRAALFSVAVVLKLYCHP